MRNLALVGLLVCTSAAAVAYVVVHPDNAPSAPTAPVAAETESPPCDSCCTNCKSEVVDVVDLGTAYPVGTPSGIAGVSFDEPPLAKPRQPELIPARFEEPASELAPAPREAAELAPVPRILK